MAIVFVVEDGTGKSDSTSYVSVSEADDISDLNIYTAAAWDALSNASKENLLMYCTKSLDARTKWKGEKTNILQALEWPRKEVTDKYGNTVSDNSVPFNLRMAVVEFAKWNATADKISNETPSSVTQEIKVDSITVKFADASKIATAQFELPDFILDLLKGYGTTRKGGTGPTFGRVVRTA